MVNRCDQRGCCRDAAVDPAGGVVGEQRVRQRREDDRAGVVERRGRQGRAAQPAEIQTGLRDREPTDQVDREVRVRRSIDQSGRRSELGGSRVDVEAGLVPEWSSGIGDDVEDGGETVALLGVGLPVAAGDAEEGGEEVAGIVVALGEWVGHDLLEGEGHEDVEALVLTDQEAESFGVKLADRYSSEPVHGGHKPSGVTRWVAPGLAVDLLE
jgi:hypothetical protein